MNDLGDSHELEELLRRNRPAGPPDGLRREVLAAVSRELSPTERHSSGLRRRIPGLGWLVAASIGLGITLNVWAMSAERARDVRLFGRIPTPRGIVEVAESVRSITDTQTGALFEQNLRRAWQAQLARQPSNPRDLIGIYDKLNLTPEARNELQSL